MYRHAGPASPPPHPLSAHGAHSQPHLNAARDRQVFRIRLVIERVWSRLRQGGAEHESAGLVCRNPEGRAVCQQGLGNRLPGLVTAFALALLTDRVLFVDDAVGGFYGIFSPTFDCNYTQSRRGANFRGPVQDMRCTVPGSGHACGACKVATPLCPWALFRTWLASPQASKPVFRLLRDADCG